MSSDFDSWIAAARDDESHWEALIERSLSDCNLRTGTSVLSRKLPFNLSKEGPLHGVPFALKEAFDIEGFPTTSSSRAPCLTRPLARKTSEVVKHLSSLGAVCVAKSQMNELAYGLSGENPHYGDCPHPSIPGALSGGSSSGSAYLVGAGIVPLGIGTDTGGSVRVPAAWCGTFGIRWIPYYMTDGMMPLASSFDTLGWFTKSAADMGKSIAAWFDFELGAESPEPLRIAALPAEVYVERETRETLRGVFDRLPLSDWSAASEWDALLPDARVAFNILQSTEAYQNFADTIEAHGVLLDPAVVGRINRGRDWTDEERLWAADTRAMIQSMFAQFFEEFDCLVMPICPGPARGATHARVKLREDTLNLTALASVAGLPALAVPVFLDETRSVGLQFIFKEPEPKLPLKLLELWSNI